MSDIMHDRAKEILELKRQDLKRNPHSGDGIQEGQLKDMISALSKACVISIHVSFTVKHSPKEWISSCKREA